MKNHLLFTAAFLLLFGSLSAQTEFDLSKPLAGRLQHLGRTQALRDLPEVRRDTGLPFPVREVPNFIEAADTAAGVSVPGQPDPVRQNAPGHQAAPALLLNIDGLNMAQTGPVDPPDPTGEVGPNHYIQLTNGPTGCVALIIDKAGDVKKAPFQLNTLWQDIDQLGAGDGIVLYDQLYDRWLLTEFSDAFGQSSKLLLAVSVTADPLGSWEVYTLNTPSFPDYPKYALWHDALVISTNELDSYIPVYGVNRKDLFTLQPAPRVQRLNGILKKTDTNFLQLAAPVDVDGFTEPPAGNDPLLLRLVNDDFTGDRVELHAAHFDWDHVQQSGMGPVESIPIAPFSLPPCYLGCLTVPGGGSVLSITGVPMNRASYRNFGAYESLLFNFTVDAGDGFNAIRWVELRKTATGGAWAVYQEGTFTPDNGQRWMGSLAQDDNGNIALGYSVAGAQVKGALRFSGHNSSDPAGWLSVAETELAGGNPDFYLDGRWGDYFNMTVDPVDDKTFWFTGEYVKEPFPPVWATKIAAFQLRRDSHDLGPVALATPVDSSTGAAETVRIRVYNFGLSPESGFTVGYKVDNEAPVIEMPDTTLAPGAMYEHAFPVPADLSAFGTHPFVLFTALAGDESPSNDTLRRATHHRTQQDAGVVAVSGISFTPVCPSELEATVGVRNFGAQVLDSFELYWQVNNGPLEHRHVSVSIQSGKSGEIKIPVQTSSGAKQLTLFTALPNGLPDEAPDNDTLQRSLQIIDGGEIIRAELTTDAAPNELLWYFSGPGGQAIDNSGGTLKLAQHTYVYNWCIKADSCYTFNLYDFGLNGMNAGSPPGDLKIYRANGELVYALPNPAFGFTVSARICLSLDCAGLSALAETQLPSGPDEQDGKIVLHATGGVPPYTYSFNNQQQYTTDSTLLNTGFFNGLVFVQDATGCIIGLYVGLQDCQIDAALTVTPSAPNSATGGLSLAVSGGNPPFRYALDNETPQASPGFTGLAVGYHTVCVQDAFQCEECFFATVGVASAAKDLPTAGNWFRAIPNPAGDFFRIEAGSFPGVESLPYRLYDGTGRLMRQGDLNRWGNTLVAPVDARGLPAGVYAIWVLGMKTMLRVAVE